MKVSIQYRIHVKGIVLVIHRCTDLPPRARLQEIDGDVTHIHVENKNEMQTSCIKLLRKMMDIERKEAVVLYVHDDIIDKASAHSFFGHTFEAFDTVLVQDDYPGGDESVQYLCTSSDDIVDSAYFSITKNRYGPPNGTYNLIFVDPEFDDADLDFDIEDEEEGFG